MLARLSLSCLPLGLLLPGLVCAGGGDPAADLLLPDLVVRRADLFDHETRRSGQQTLLRLSNGTANVGRGKLHLFGVPGGDPGTTQDVMQRIFRPDGSFLDRLAARFVFHDNHGHIHVEAWARYRLRQVLPDGSVGEVIAQSDKTSFCIIDLQVFRRDLPGFAARGEFHSCASTTQGLSIGWIDVYGKSIPGQSIDVTGVPSGTYWLESEVDPDDHFVESDEGNNIERIQVTLGDLDSSVPDVFEDNDTREAVDLRPSGGPNSPNLGPTDPRRRLPNLTLHDLDDIDLFKFYVNSTGAARDFVLATSSDAGSRLDLALVDSAGELVSAATPEPGEPPRISLAGVPQGWYYVRVALRAGASAPVVYDLTIDPPADSPPRIEVLAPGEGNVDLFHGLEFYAVRWQSSDPDGDPTWVSVFVNSTPELDGGEELLPTSLFTDGATGFHVINSSGLKPGTYWVYCQVTDGGTTRGSWSAGTVSFLELPEDCATLGGDGADCDGNGILDSCEVAVQPTRDCDGNLVLDSCDIAAGTHADDDGDGVPDACGRPFHRGDSNDDGVLDVSDAIAILGHLFLGSPALSCREAADANSDGDLDISDGVAILGYLFLGDLPPGPPGPPDAPCGFDPQPLESGRRLGCDAYESC